MAFDWFTFSCEIEAFTPPSERACVVSVACAARVHVACPRAARDCGVRLEAASPLVAPGKGTKVAEFRSQKLVPPLTQLRDKAEGKRRTRKE
ncbi:unnamed protein product [Lampetra planeri]